MNLFRGYRNYNTDPYLRSCHLGTTFRLARTEGLQMGKRGGWHQN